MIEIYYHSFRIMLVLFICILVCTTQDAQSQGFDWQYSSRLPSTYPRLFLGGSVSGIYGFHTADIYSLGEEYRCGDYKQGVETGISAAAVGEYWLPGSMVAFWGMIGLRTSTTRFTSLPPSEPFRRNGVEFELRREFAMDIYLKALLMEAGMKYRIGRTHAHLGIGFRTDLVLSTLAEQTETILTPVEFTQAIAYGEQRLTGMRTLLITPLLAAGYDAELGKGIYATPRITIGIPMISRSSVVSWSEIELTAGVSFLVNW